MAEAEGFEPSSLKGHHDFEQKAVSTASPLSVPEMCNTSADFARNSKTNDFLREICEIDARNHLKPLCVLGQFILLFTIALYYDTIAIQFIAPI